MPYLSYVPLPQHTKRAVEALCAQLYQRLIAKDSHGRQHSADIEMEGVAGENTPFVIPELLAAAPKATVFQTCVLALEALAEYITVCVLTARLFRACFITVDNFYPFGQKDDDAKVYNPFFDVMFSLACLEMSLGLFEIAKNRWQTTKLNVSNAEVLTEFLESILSVTGLCLYTTNLLSGSSTLKELGIYDALGISMGVLQLVSDVKGQNFSSTGHSHSSASGRPVSDSEYQQTSQSQRMMNGALRLLHSIAHPIVCMYSMMEVLNAFPLPNKYFLEDPYRAVYFTAPFAIAYGLANALLISQCLWAEELPAYTMKLNYLDMLLHALTNMCLAFNAVYFFTATSQLNFKHLISDDQIAKNEVDLFTSVIGPALIGALAVLFTSIRQHHFMFGEELQRRVNAKSDPIQTRQVAEQGQSRSVITLMNAPNKLIEQGMGVLRTLTIPLDKRSFVTGLDGFKQAAQPTQSSRFSGLNSDF